MAFTTDNLNFDWSVNTFRVCNRNPLEDQLVREFSMFELKLTRRGRALGSLGPKMKQLYIHV